MTTGNSQFVLFHVGTELYALHTKQVRRIERGQPFRPIPNADVFVRGIITVEEEIVTLLDLRTKFGAHNPSMSPSAYHIIVCNLAEGGDWVGLMVDAVLEVKDLPHSSDLAGIHHTLSGPATDYIQGLYRFPPDSTDPLADSLIVVLHLYRLLGLEEPAFSDPPADLH